MSEAYANELEEWFASFPSVLQEPLRPIFEKMTEGLRWVAGDPPQLVAAAEVYVDAGARLRELVRVQVADRGRLAGQWNGESYEAFCAKMEGIEERLTKLAEATGSTKEILEAAAEAAVEGANMIIEIIVMVLGLLLAEFLIDAALSAITLGASVVAFIAEAIADGLSALAEIFSVVSEVAAALMKLAEILRKVAEVIKAVIEVLAELKRILGAIDEAKEGASLLGKVGMTAYGKGLESGLIYAIDKGSGGYVKIPEDIGAGVEAGHAYVGAWSAADEAVDAAHE